MENNIDKLFREKIDDTEKLPENIIWSSDKGWSDYEGMIKAKKTIMHKRIFYLSSIAAATLLFFIYVFQSAGERQVTVENNSDKAKEVMLPDGNSVWLNKNSTLKYTKSIKREFKICIVGEAYFEIVKYPFKSFSVNAFNANILVEIPSAFNIKANNSTGHIDITVKKGSVKVSGSSLQEGLAILVTENNYCSVHKSQKLVYVTNNLNNNFLSWKTGELIFDSMPMANVTDVIAEFYGKKIVIEDVSLAYCRFSGSFENQSFDNILKKMQTDLNINIIHTDSSIILSGKGCL